MNILHVSKSYFPQMNGFELPLADFVNEQNAPMVYYGGVSGNDVSVLTCQKGDHESEVIDDVVINRCSARYIKREPVSPSFRSDFKDFVSRADTVYLHLPFFMGEVCAATLKISAPLIVFWHAGYEYQENPGHYANPFLNLTLSKAKEILIFSKNQLQNTPVLKSYATKCKVIPIPIDWRSYEETVVSMRLSESRETYKPNFQKFNSAEVLTNELRTSESKKILYVGRLGYAGRLDLLFSCFENFIESNVKAEIFIVSRGKIEYDLQIFLIKKGYCENVHITENADEDFLACAFSDCDFYVSPRIENEEDIYNQLLAFTFGKAVLTVALSCEDGALNSYVGGDTVTGLVVKRDDTSGFAAGLLKLINDDELSRLYGINAFKIIRGK